MLSEILVLNLERTWPFLKVKFSQFMHSSQTDNYTYY
uniref:Uncharacterized protein n=1 Tax=Anguilla anguilla TaxID=7936 RepID=A0A0E9VU81_ANGAN